MYTDAFDLFQYLGFKNKYIDSQISSSSLNFFCDPGLVYLPT